jgi:hypothetical protein
LILNTGNQDVKANLECRWDYDDANRSLNLKRLKVHAEKMGEAELRLNLQNINPTQFESIPRNAVVLLAMISGIKIVNAQFTYKEASFLRRIYEAGASRSQQPVEKYIEDITHRIDKLILEKKDPDTRQLLKAIREFAGSPDDITILVKPKTPVPIGRLYFLRYPEQAVELLGIRAES